MLANSAPGSVSAILRIVSNVTLDLGMGRILIDCARDCRESFKSSPNALETPFERLVSGGHL